MVEVEVPTAGPHYGKLTLYQEEDWFEEVRLIDPADGNPYDLTGHTVEWWARPTADFSPKILTLTSDSTPPAGQDHGILILDEPGGEFRFFWAQANIALFGSNSSHGWFQYLVLRSTHVTHGPRIQSIWRGPLYVLAGSRAS